MIIVLRNHHDWRLLAAKVSHQNQLFCELVDSEQTLRDPAHAVNIKRLAFSVCNVTINDTDSTVVLDVEADPSHPSGARFVAAYSRDQLVFVPTLKNNVVVGLSAALDDSVDRNFMTVVHYVTADTDVSNIIGSPSVVYASWRDGRVAPTLESDPPLGSWVDADSITQLAIQLDIALNGRQTCDKPAMCDVVSQAVEYIKQHK